MNSSAFLVLGFFFYIFFSNKGGIRWGLPSPLASPLQFSTSKSCYNRRKSSLKLSWVNDFCIISLLGTRHYRNTSHWKKQDFQLITCLVRSTFGEIWQARLRGSNRVVRIRLSAGSDDVYVYDKQVAAKNTNVNTTRVV